MRIISPFHDYYDSVQAHGQDQSMIYVRKPEEITFDHKAAQRIKGVVGNPYPLFTSDMDTGGVRYAGDSLAVRLHSIGFCGKVYPCFELRDRNRPGSDEVAMCHSVEDVDAFVQKHFPKAFHDYAAKDRGKGSYRWWRSNHKDWSHRHRREAWVEAFAAFKAREDDFARLFEEKLCPVFVGTMEASRNLHIPWRDQVPTLTYNAELKPFDFQRVMDPFTAFQEITMFMGNLAFPDKPMKTMTNEENAARLGHGYKYSFRTLPTKHG